MAFIVGAHFAHYGSNIAENSHFIFSKGLVLVQLS